MVRHNKPQAHADGPSRGLASQGSSLRSSANLTPSAQANPATQQGSPNRNWETVPVGFWRRGFQPRHVR